MVRDVAPQHPRVYQIRREHCQCRACGHEFTQMMAADNALIKFVNDVNTEEGWLPTYEPGGYLDLLERLVPDYHRSEPITMSISDRFTTEFRKIQQPPESGGYWNFAIGGRCVQCASKQLDVTAEELLDTPPLEWITYQGSA